MAVSMQLLSLFIFIAATRSQTILSGTCASGNSQFDFLMMDEQCAVQSQSRNGTEAPLPTAPFLKIQSKNPEVTVEMTNSTIARGRQIKIGSGPHKHKMYTFQEDHAKLRIRVFQGHTHHSDPHKMKVEEALQGSVTEMNTSAHIRQPRKITVAKASQMLPTNARSSSREPRKIKVAKPAMKAQSSSRVQENALQKTQRSGSFLLSSGQVTPEEVKKNLILELKATFRTGGDHSRISKWEKVIQPLYLSLSKNAYGNLEHAAARYVLHRAFVRQHGWSIKGLEPRNTSSDTLKEWVPEYLLNAIEQFVGTKGITSQELAVLAATFEDLAHKEAIARLRDVYEVKRLPVDNPISKDVAEKVVATYMTVYTADLGNSLPKTVNTAVTLGLGLEEHTKRWLRKVQSDVTGSQMLLSGASKELNFKTTARIVEEVGERYGDFNDFECRALKEIMIGQQSHSKPGMLRLSDFYRMGMNQTYWNFNEKPDYLRVLGALDESGSEPHVVIPNYISSLANCVPVSSFYSVCCRSECESLMDNLERKLESPTANPDAIAKAVAAFPAGVVAAPAELSQSSLNLLKGIAATHDGLVPLHSREFAQWMHHEFPLECPVPHGSSQDDVQDPQTPDEWLKEFGPHGTKASKDEISRHIGGSSDQVTEVSIPQPVSRTPLLVKHRPVSAFTHLKNALFLQAETEDKEETLPWQPAMQMQDSLQEEALPCVESLEALEPPMPWDPEECTEEVFTELKAEVPRKLKVQAITEDAVGISNVPEQQRSEQKLSLKAFFEQPEEMTGIMHGPEEQPLMQKKLSLKALLESPTDIKPKEAVEPDILWDVYNEPAQSYWEREDRASQELDKAELPEVPTVPPQPAERHGDSHFLPFEMPSSSDTASPRLEEALISSIHQFGALLALALILTLVMVVQSASSKPTQDKIYNPYSKIHLAHQDQLLRAAAVQSSLRRSSQSSQDIV